MPTEYGCPAIFRGWRPATDAACVTLARKAGAVVVGKTVTPAFACGAAVPTNNPLNLDHTSGGSSSGSCAAVAARMVPVAFGTQTASSVIRPASYTGVVGMRPSVGVINVAGLKPFSRSFDTLGLIARTVEDVELLWTVQVGLPLERSPASPQGRRLRIAICHPPWLAGAQPCAREAIDIAERRLRTAGHGVANIVLPAGFAQLPTVHHEIQVFEMARSYAHEYELRRDGIDQKVQGFIREGLAISFDNYLELLDVARRARREFAELLGDADCLLTAAAPGEAPKGIRALGAAFTSMGDPAQSRAWTLLQVPAIMVPCHMGPAGLPVGVQLIGRYGHDRDLLRHARAIESQLVRG
jgi:amidase